MEDTNLIAFKAVASFVNDLSEVFGKKQKSLALYGRLIQKTGIVHSAPILKHLDIFREFCVCNRDAIQSQNKDNLKQSKLSYNDKVYIDMSSIFNMADKDTSDVIWNHILTISALLDPANNAKQILKANIEKKTQNGESSTEEQFLNNLIEKVEKSIDPKSVNENPMNAISGLMSSGVFTDLIGTMQNGLNNGDLNINKLFSTVQNMMGNAGLDQSSGGMPGMPDLSMMMNMMGGMNMGGNGMPNISEVDEDEK
jgi:hypothetical protein